MMTCHQQAVLLLFVACLIAVVAWWPAPDAPFYLDSRLAVAENPDIRVTELRPWQLYRAAASSPHGDGRFIERWLPQLTYGLDYWLRGPSAAGFRATNLVIHVINGLLVFALIGRLFETPALCRLSRPRLGQAALIAAATASLWLVNPVQTGAVTYVWGRPGLLATTFYLLALLAFLQARLGRPGVMRLVWWLCVPACWLLALSAKEIAATLPATLLLVEWFFLRDLRLPGPRLLAMLAVLFALVVGVAALLFLGLDPIRALLGGYVRRDFNLVERVMTQWRVIIDYVSLLALPLPGRLTLEHQPVISRGLLSPSTTLAALLALVGAVVIAAVVARHHRLAAFAILWFLLHLAIESTVVPLELMFEHRVYLPSIGLSMLVALGLAGLPGRYTAVVAVLGLSILWGSWTWQRNQLWSDPVAFWQAATAAEPASERAWLHLGRVQQEAGRYAEAAAAFGRGIVVLESRPGLGTNSKHRLVSLLIARALANRALGELAQVESDLLRARGLRPGPSMQATIVRVELASVRLARGRPAAALAEVDALLAESAAAPPQALALRGAALLALGRPREAVAALDRAVSLEPRADWIALRERAKAMAGSTDPSIGSPAEPTP